MSERYVDHGRAYYAWRAIRGRAFIRDFGILVFREGKGGYNVFVHFVQPGPIRMVFRSAVGPTRDLAALQHEVDRANADGGTPAFEVGDPFVYLTDTIPRDDTGFTIEALDECRERLCARMDAWHDTFAAIGRRPFGVHIDDAGNARLVVDD